MTKSQKYHYRVILTPRKDRLDSFKGVVLPDPFKKVILTFPLDESFSKESI